MRELLAVSLSLGLGLMVVLAAPAAGDEDRVCRNEALVEVTVGVDVTVPAGAHCRISRSTLDGDLDIEEGGSARVADATVRGDVHVGENALLSAQESCSDVDAVVIGGNLQATAGSRLDLWGCRGDDMILIEGDLRARRASSVWLDGVSVGGDVRVTEAGLGPTIMDSIIAGDLRFARNGPHSSVVDNAVGGDCGGRKNAVWVSSFGNTVEGDIRGQCNCQTDC